MKGPHPRVVKTRCSQEFDGVTHGSLDVDGLHVVPSLFEERDQEVKAHHDVLAELIIGHVLSAGADTHAGDLSELELHGCAEILHGKDELLVVGDGNRELLDSVKNGSANDGNLLDHGIGGNEGVVLLGPLLDDLLVLVVLLELIEGGDIDVETVFLGFNLVLLIGDHADLEVGAGDVGKSDGSDETLILLGIVVLEAELDLNGLSELADLGGSAHVFDGFENHGVVNFGSHLERLLNTKSKHD